MNNHINEPVAFGEMFGAIEILPDGTSFLASSNMRTRYWSGYISTFKSPKDLSDITNCKIHQEFDGGVGCAKFVSNSKVVVGLDTGCVSMLDIDTGNVLASVTEHDDYVSSLSISSDRTRIVSGSFDKSLKVWSTDYLVCSHTFRPAHSHEVVDISYHPEDNNIFASVSGDGQIALWDLRQSKPALALPKHFNSLPSCLSFCKTGRFDLFVGTASGHVLVVDVSSTATNYLPMLELEVLGCGVRAIFVAPHSAYLIAACGGSEMAVASVDPSHPGKLYSARHEDFIGGLAWTGEGDLFSSSWDRTIVQHNTSSLRP